MLIGSVTNGVKLGSQKFEILGDGEIDYFCEEYEKHWSKLGEAEKEKLKNFDNRFRRLRLMPTG